MGWLTEIETSGLLLAGFAVYRLTAGGLEITWKKGKLEFRFDPRRGKDDKTEYDEKS